MDSSGVTTCLLFNTPLRAAQQRIAFQAAMHVDAAHSVRQDRGVLGCQPSALVAVAGEGPGGRNPTC